MRFMNSFKFLGVNENFGAGAFVIVFAMVVVQVGMDDGIDAFRYQAVAL